MGFLEEINWSPLWISLKTGFIATVLAFFIGVYCASKVMKLKPVTRGILDGFLQCRWCFRLQLLGFCF